MKRYYRIIQIEDYFIPQYKSWFLGFWRGISGDFNEWFNHEFQVKYCMHISKDNALLTINFHQKLIKLKKTKVVHKETFKL